VSASWAAVARAWDRFWFGLDATRPLELVRAGTGIAFLAAYVPLGWRLEALYSGRGIVPLPEAIEGWRFSLLDYVNAPWQLALVHGVVLAAAAALAAGWWTLPAKWLLLLGHLSYVHRNPGLRYGLDGALAALIVIICVAPVGRALRLGRPAPEPPPSAWGSACLRLLQMQVALTMLASGARKLEGDSWWGGYAVWVAVTNDTFANIPVGWLAEHFWIVNALTWFTLVFELAYPVLIWPRLTRPVMLAGALALHAGFGVMMGLYAFSLAMAVAHLAFVPAAWLRKAAAVRSAAASPA